MFILDWDIHHGNGIQDLTYDDPNIMYVSIHRGPGRQDRNWFYPGTGFPNECGKGDGVGTNINILWNQGGMANVEYSAAFTEAVLPALQGYQPDLILIACGLDAAKGDLLGDCGLTPDMYYTMTQSLLDVAGTNVPIVAVLEGGYNLDVCAACMEQVALALLDEPSDLMTNKKYNKAFTKPWVGSSTRPKWIGSGPTLLQSESTFKAYWDPDAWDGTLGTITKKATRAALSSIMRSTKALGKIGISLHDSHSFDGLVAMGTVDSATFPSKSHKHLGSENLGSGKSIQDEDEGGIDGHHEYAWDYTLADEIDCHRPIKKRKNRF